MVNVIYDYPKTSCSCLKCDENKFSKPVGNPTNMSVRGCIFSESYDCNPQRQFKVQQEPTDKSGYILLNKSVVSSEKYDKTFKSINVKNCPKSSCTGTTFLSSDPRLYNAAAATWLQLDKPPLNSTIKLNTLTTNKDLDRYGQGYKSYADINAGQYLYYIGKNIEDVFFEPLFSKKATMLGTLYQDPMSVIKPQYDRIPNEKQDHAILTNPCDVSGEYGLSYLKDTQFHREDILARQMNRNNQERYAPRWTGSNQ